MNVEEMKRRATVELASRYAPHCARDVLTLLAERERLAEEHDGIMNAPSVVGAPRMVAGKVLRIEFHRPERGPTEVATRMLFAWSETAARAAAEGCGESVTLVLDAKSAVRAAYGEKARLDALLAALRSVDERELPEHVAAALRALDTPATHPAADPRVSSR